MVERPYLVVEPELLWELHKDLRICTLHAECKRQIQQEKITDHAHTLDSFRLPRWQLWLPSHIIVLEHTQTKRDQGVICLQRCSVNKSDRYTLSRVSDRLDRRVERHLVRGQELGFLLNERLETALINRKLIVRGEASGSDVEGVVVALNQR